MIVHESNDKPYKGEMLILSIRLHPDIERRLSELAQRTGRTMLTMIRSSSRAIRKIS